MRRFTLAAALLLIAAACGGDGAGVDEVVGAPVEGEVVVSSDSGLATILIPEGVLPKNVAASDVVLTTAADTSDPSFPLISVSLEPHGLVLEAPATLSLRLPDDAPSGTIALHQSGDSYEFLEGTIEVDDQGLVFQAELNSFSTVSLSGVPLTTGIGLDPPQVVVGQAQIAIGGIAPIESFNVQLYFTPKGDPAGTARQYVFTAPVGRVIASDGRMSWGTVLGSSFAPQSTDVSFRGQDGGWVSDPAVATCGEPGDESVHFFAPLTFNIELISIGEALAAERLPFLSDVFGPSDVSGNPAAAGGFSQNSISEIGIGDTISASVSVRHSEGTVCLTSDVAATSTTTTTEPQRDPDGSQRDPEGDTGGTGSSGSSDSADAEATDIVSLNVKHDKAEGTYTFTMKVKGNGLAAATSELNSWYNPRFYVNNEHETNTYQDGGFSVDVSWFGGKEMHAPVYVDHSGYSVPEARVTSEWIDESTLKVVVKHIDSTDVANARVEMVSRFNDGQEHTTGSYEDTAYWTVP